MTPLQRGNLVLVGCLAAMVLTVLGAVAYLTYANATAVPDIKRVPMGNGTVCYLYTNPRPTLSCLREP